MFHTITLKEAKRKSYMEKVKFHWKNQTKTTVR